MGTCGEPDWPKTFSALSLSRNRLGKASKPVPGGVQAAAISPVNTGLGALLLSKHVWHRLMWDLLVTAIALVFFLITDLPTQHLTFGDPMCVSITHVCVHMSAFCECQRTASIVIPQTPSPFVLFWDKFSFRQMNWYLPALNKEGFRQ